MEISYADAAIATRRRAFSFRAAVFAALWLTVVIGPPFLYADAVREVYINFKVELPTATRAMLEFAAWNELYWEIWLLAPIIAGVLAARLSRDDGDAFAIIHRRQEKLYAGLLLTLTAMLITVCQMAVIWLPWMSVIWSVSGSGSSAPSGAPAGQ